MRVRCNQLRLSEETDRPREVIEAALAHVVTNRTEAGYARSDLFERRRRLMDEWAAYLEERRSQVPVRTNYCFYDQ